MPDFSRTPAVIGIAANLPYPYNLYMLNAVSAASAGYNAILEGYLVYLETVALPDIEITRMDTFSILNEVIADPGSADLEIVDEACVIPGTQGGALCANPGRYLFWDGIHPTGAGHKYLGQQAAALLGVYK